MKAEKSTDHLCMSCKIQNCPECIPDNVKLGDGFGDDNIIECENYDVDTGEKS